MLQEIFQKLILGAVVAFIMLPLEVFLQTFYTILNSFCKHEKCRFGYPIFRKKKKLVKMVFHDFEA